MSKYSGQRINQGELGIIHLLMPLVVLGLLSSSVVLLNLRVTTNTSGETKVKGILIARGGDDSGDSHESSSGSSGGDSGKTESKPTAETVKTANPGAATVNTAKSAPREVKELKLNVKKVEVEKKEKEEAESENKIENEIEQSLTTKSGETEFKLVGGKVAVSSRKSKSGAESNIGQVDKIKIKVKEGEKESEIELKAEDGRFEFKAKGVAAQSNFPLSVNNVTGELSVQTPQGTKIIRLLPNQVAEVALRAGVQNKIEAIEVSENEQEKDENGVVFKVQGTKSGKLLGLIPVSAPVETQIGAQTGTVVSVNEPAWFKLISTLVR